MENPIRVDRGKLTLKIKSATDLVSVDMKRLCTPFLEITVGNQTIKTKKVKKTLDPTWNETHQFNLENVGQDTFILIRCMSKRRVHKPDYLGEIKLFLAGIKSGVEKEIDEPLMNTESGRLQFSVLSDFSVKEFPPIETLPKGEKLLVKILSFRGSYTCNRYIQLTVEEQIFKTQVDNSYMQEINFDYTVEVTLPEISQMTVLPFAVYSPVEQEGQTDIFQGCALVPLENSVKGKPIRRWFPLYAGEGEVEVELIPQFDLKKAPLPVIQDRINIVVDHLVSTLEYYTATKRYVYDENDEGESNEEFKGTRTFRMVKSITPRVHNKRQNVKTAGIMVWFVLTLPYQIKHINFC